MTPKNEKERNRSLYFYHAGQHFLVACSRHVALYRGVDEGNSFFCFCFCFLLLRELGLGVVLSWDFGVHAFFYESAFFSTGSSQNH